VELGAGRRAGLLLQVYSVWGFWAELGEAGWGSTAVRRAQQCAHKMPACSYDTLSGFQFKWCEQLAAAKLGERAIAGLRPLTPWLAGLIRFWALIA